MHFSTIRVSRRAALHSFAAAAALTVAAGAGLAGPVRRAGAQQEIDPSFSNEILPTLGLPELSLERTVDGLQGAPASIPAKKHLVNYTATGVVGYLLFAQHPAGLTEEQVLEQARLAGSMDQQQEGWVYGGGSNADPNTTVQVVIDLTPGDWAIVTSAIPPEGNWETDETYAITPLTVTEAAADAATPVAALPVDVPVEMPGNGFVMETGTIAAGPKLWEFRNSGDQAHHMVMMRTPRLISNQDMQALFEMFGSSTPPAGDHWFVNSAWVAYTALVSPGYTVWNEFDLDPGAYAMLCFIAETETGMPHLMMGMWTPFTVE